jgi:hypothetical protein
MKKNLASLIALSLATAIVASGAAEARTKKKRAYVQPRADQGYTAPRNDYKYEEFIAERRRTGTSSWWEQMDREGRGGQSRAN